jgi:outer membrane lipoprotein-sorting protein
MRKSIFISLLFCLPILALAQDWNVLNSDASELSELKSALAKMESISGDIEQVKSFAFLNNKLVSKGKFYFQQDNKLRWAFNDPIEYIILINENSMRLKEEGEEKKYKGMNQILRQVKEIILGCIDGSIMSNSNYKTEFSRSEELIRIQLKPKSKNLKEFIQQIDVQFSIDGAVLRNVVLTDPSGDLTNIQFSNIESNKQIDEKLFADF